MEQLFSNFLFGEILLGGKEEPRQGKKKRIREQETGFRE